MNQGQKKLNPILLIIILILILAVISGAQYLISNYRGVVKGPAIENLKFKEIKKEDAKKALLSGEIDIYAGSLSSEDAKELKNNSAVTLYPATSTIFGFYVNPYPGSTTELNPFSIKEVRYAMQFLVNRQEIADNVFSGFAKPTLTMPWNEHPDYENIKSSVDGMGISYDKEKAMSLIKKGMEASGAVQESGVWMFKGKPVSMIISSSNRDDFSKVADMLKSSLEDAGFAVNITYTDSKDPEAKDPESYTDAAELKWNISISGWVFYSQSKIANASILEAYADEGWWEYVNPEIEKLEDSQKNYKSEEERKNINNELVKKYLDDSTCIWLATVESVSAARKNVKGLIQDEFIGIKNLTNLREAYITGKNTLTVGIPQTYEEKNSWNHWIVNDINMMYILNTVHDPAKWNETYTLKEAGFRWSYSIVNQGLDATIDIPSDSFTWDGGTKEWISVGKDKKVVTKVTYDLSEYIGSKWHHGQEITQADVVYNIARIWDISVNEEKQKIDSEGYKDFFSSIEGIRIYDKTLEVYLNTWSIDDGDLLNIARVFQRAAPWELYATTDDLVFNQRLYDYQEVNGSENEKLNLIKQDHVAAVIKTAKAIEFAKIQPMMTMGNTVYAQESDLDSRVSSLEIWAVQHKHLYINDGPFYIHSFNPDKSIDLKAFRDTSYPFSAGYWRK
jgi:peptide/nickel transport system substrate-binding protein